MDVDLAWISLGALLVTILISCFSKLNPGVVALAFAWVVGVYVAPLTGAKLGVKDLVAGFPGDLFLTIVGVTLLFSAAQLNGTLERVARLAERACRGHRSLMPIVFFLFALIISSIGAGSIAAVALIAPLAMAAAQRSGGSPLLMMIVVAHGGVGGTMSPFASTGVIANGILAKMGLENFEGRIYTDNLLSNTFVSVLAYVVLEGRQWFRPAVPAASAETKNAAKPTAAALQFESKHLVTLLVLGLLVVGVVFFKIHVGFASFAATLFLALFRLIDEGAALKAVPWSVIVMVCGVTVLVEVMTRTGGTKLFSEKLAEISTVGTVNGLSAFLTAVVSIYSSTSGVVLPAFLPTVPDLVADLHGGDVLSIASSMCVGSNLVDVSPLSTVGALCIACVEGSGDRRKFFLQLLAWGVSMSVVAAVFCYLFVR